MKNKSNDIECLVCGGIYFRKGYSVAIYEKYDEGTRWNEKAKAKVEFDMESEEEHPLKKVPEHSNSYSYVCEDCGFIMSFTKEKNVESRREERLRKQKQKMYDWSKFK